MAAPKGNQFWKVRSSHGRKPIFKSPDELRDACYEYFQWVEENPLYEQKAFHSNGIITTADLPKMRAMTIGGLCIFLDISRETWNNYQEKEDFFAITREVEQIIYNQKFEGAAADLLNNNIIARELGLKEHSENTINMSPPITGVRIVKDGATKQPAVKAGKRG